MRTDVDHPAPAAYTASGATAVQRPAVSLGVRRRAAAKAKATVALSAAAFRQLAYSRGWTLQEVAQRWGYTLPWLSKLIAKPDRPRHLDDALRGLPRIGRPLPLPAHWRNAEDGADSLEHAERQAAASRRQAPLAPGLRYAGYMVLGAVVAVQKDVGSIAEEGMHGVVVQVLRIGATSSPLASETYRVIFETGAIEQFTPDLVDEFLVTTGLERDALRTYGFSCDEQLTQDFDSGMFEFW